MQRQRSYSILRLPALIAAFLVKGYQWGFSPVKVFFWGSTIACRFHPTCSHYAYKVLLRYGLIKGLGLSLWRLLRCHPFHPGGYDPVPENEKSKNQGFKNQRAKR